MMVLKIINEQETVLEDITKMLLKKKLISCATVDAPSVFFETNALGGIVRKEKYVLSAISKSLLFKKINDVLREKYKDKTPLIYSEPIIMLDPEQTEALLSKLIKT